MQIFALSQRFAYVYELFPYSFKGIESTDPLVHLAALRTELLCGAFESQALHLDQILDLPEGVEVLGRVEAVSLGIARRVDVFRERVGPEAHERHGGAERFRSFTDSII